MTIRDSADRFLPAVLLGSVVFVAAFLCVDARAGESPDVATLVEALGGSEPVAAMDRLVELGMERYGVAVKAGAGGG